jgi:regulator of sigma E protease
MGIPLPIERDGTLQDLEIPVDFIETLLDNPDRMRFLGYASTFCGVWSRSRSCGQSGGRFSAMDQVLSINGETAYYLDQAKDILARNKGTRGVCIW